MPRVAVTDLFDDSDPSGGIPEDDLESSNIPDIPEHEPSSSPAAESPTSGFVEAAAAVAGAAAEIAPETSASAEAVLEALLESYAQQSDPWSYVNSIAEQNVPQEHRQRFYQNFIAMVATRPQAEQDALLNRGQQVFRFRADTARRDVETLRESGADTIKITPFVATGEFVAKAVQAEIDAPVEFYVRRFADGAEERADRVQVGSVVFRPSQSGLVQADPLPWPDPVDGAALLNDFVETFHRYLALPPHVPEAIAGWTLFAHAHEAFDISPMLAITSPTMRCGKTTLLRIVRALVPRPLLASNVSPAALFRVIEVARPTLLIDEADRFVAASDELTGLLNAGHTKDTAQVIRTVGDQHEGKVFSTWCGKAIAQIGKLTATNQDRALGITMRRRTSGEHVERLRMNRVRGQFRDLSRRAGRWVFDHWQELADPEADPLVPDALHDRAADNWRPLFRIADLVGGGWPERARAAALALAGIVDETENSDGIRLLRDLHSFVAQEPTQEPSGPPRPYIASTAIVNWLSALPDSQWVAWGRRERPLTTGDLAGLLRPFDISPKTFRDGSRTPRGYARADFEDAFVRYLPAAIPDMAETAATPQHGADVSGSVAPGVSGSGCPVTYDQHANVLGVAAVLPSARTSGRRAVPTLPTSPETSRETGLPRPATPASGRRPVLAEEVQ